MKIELKYSTYDGDCEDCGPYENKQLEVSIDGELFSTHYEDGHFGNSAIDKNQVFMDILKHLGHEVVVTEE